MGWPDDWSGRVAPCTSEDAFNGEEGCPGDGLSYLSHVYISEIRIQPHNEMNDIMYRTNIHMFFCFVCFGIK